MTLQDFPNANYAPASNGRQDLIDKFFSAVAFGFVFFVIFVVLYEYRKNLQWDHFIETNGCIEIFRKTVPFPNFEGRWEMVDEQRYLCQDDMIYVR